MANDIYEERRRLEAENKLLHEQRLNDRLKKEEASEAAVLAVMGGLHAFFTGGAVITVDPGDTGSWIIAFRREISG